MTLEYLPGQLIYKIVKNCRNKQEIEIDVLKIAQFDADGMCINLYNTSFKKNSTVRWQDQSF